MDTAPPTTPPVAAGTPPTAPTALPAWVVEVSALLDDVLTDRDPTPEPGWAARVRADAEDRLGGMPTLAALAAADTAQHADWALHHLPLADLALAHPTRRARCWAVLEVAAAQLRRHRPALLTGPCADPVALARVDHTLLAVERSRSLLLLDEREELARQAIANLAAGVVTVLLTTVHATALPPDRA